MKILGGNKFTEADHTKLDAIGTTISTAQANAIIANTAKVDLTVDGAGTVHSNNYTDTNTTYSIQDGELSQNNFTNDDHTKLDGIAAGAEVNVQSDWNSSSGDNKILNKPTIPVDLTADGAGTVHANNYTDTNTQLPLIDSDSMSGASATNVASAESVKKYVDDRYAYQYITFHCQDVMKTNWITFGNSGLSNHVWGTDLSTNGVTVDSSTVSCANTLQASAFKVPYECKLVGFTGTGYRFNGSYSFCGGVFILDAPDYGGSVDDDSTSVDSQNATLRAFANAVDGGNGFNQKLNKLEDLNRDYTVPAGAAIFPAFKDTAGENSGNFRGNMTIVLKTKIV